MIDKFNFYDIYGYFLPGLALVGVLWLPFGPVAQAWPKADWGSALLAIVAAYVLGHLMLYVSTNVVPSYDIRKSTLDQDRYPSSTVLDSDSSDLSSDMREKIARAVDRKFELNLHTEDSVGNFDAIRKDAFFLARHSLIRDKAASYAEQFQAMYSLTRGLTVAFAVGTSYYLGWALSPLRWPFSRQILVALLFLSVLVMLNLAIRLWFENNREQQQKEERKNLSEGDKRKAHREDRLRKRALEHAFAGAILLAFFVAGYLIALGYEAGGRNCTWLALASLISLVAMVRCYLQYRTFTIAFATTVWRDFTVYALSGNKQASSQQESE